MFLPLSNLPLVCSAPGAEPNSAEKSEKKFAQNLRKKSPFPPKKH